MLLVVDVGNTNTVFALFADDILIKQWRLATSPTRTADEYALSLTQLCSLDSIDYKKIDCSIISTVVPDTLFNLKTLCRKYFNCEPLIVTPDSIKTGQKILIDKPSELGADRIVNTVAAFAKYGGNNIVIDFGTATTVDISNANGDYIGGIIAPGIENSIDSLHKAAAKLPSISIEKPEKVVATNTITAMQSGFYWGYLSMIEGFVDRIEAELGCKMTTIVTGGLAPIFFGSSTKLHHLDSDLNIRGLKQIFDMNR